MVIGSPQDMGAEEIKTDQGVEREETMFVIPLSLLWHESSPSPLFLRVEVFQIHR